MPDRHLIPRWPRRPYRVRAKAQPLALDRALWSQMPGEGARAFACFELYRDMGPTRGLHVVARRVHRDVSLVKRWSTRWSWVARAAAWDRHLSVQRQQELIDQERAAVAFHAKLGRGMQVKAAQRLSGTGDVEALNASELSPQDIARLARDGIAIEREALGLHVDTGMRIEITVVNTLIAQIQDVLRMELANEPERLQRIADRLARMGPDPPSLPGGTGNGDGP